MFIVTPKNTVTPSRTTEIRPGVHVDMSNFGRTPDQRPTDMSHQARNIASARASTRGKLLRDAGLGARAARNKEK